MILQENDEIIVDSKQVSDIFNDYFVGIASTIGLKTKLLILLPPFINIKIIQV